jgi:hypothetical protein
MNIEKIKLSKIKSNINNPRIIKNEKYKQLVKSIKDFPEMLEIRPIVVDDNMVVLGGNMRLKACQELGIDEVFIIKASNLTPEQIKLFMIRDNVSYGQWDFEMLNNEKKYSQKIDSGRLFISRSRSTRNVAFSLSSYFQHFLHFLRILNKDNILNK